MKFNNQDYPILIAPTHIPELKAVERTADGIMFGASVTLSTLEDVLKDALRTLPGIHVLLLLALRVKVLMPTREGDVTDLNKNFNP